MKWYEWLDTNKGWLFPMGGTGLLLALVKTFSNLWRGNWGQDKQEEGENVNKTPSTLSSVDSDRGFKNISICNLTPSQVLKELSETPPFQREEKAQHYGGLRVKWKLTFFDIVNRKNEQAELQCTADNYGVDCYGLCVYFYLNLTLYPEVKTMARGKEIIIDGLIEDVDDYRFKLKKVQLVNES